MGGGELIAKKVPDPVVKKAPAASPEPARRAAPPGEGYAEQAAALSPKAQEAAKPAAPPKEDPLVTEARFKALFTSASKVRGAEQNTMFRGAMGNVVTTLSFGGLGDGCSAWADWAFDWVSNQAAGFGIVDYQQVHVTGMFNHNLVKVRFQSGREFALDPWRDANECVIPAAEYIAAHGPMKPGFGSGKELAGNYAEGAQFGARSLVQGRSGAKKSMGGE